VKTLPERSFSIMRDFLDTGYEIENIAAMSGT